MAHIAVDLDGTLSAAPVEMQDVLSALKACGHRISVLTGTSSDPVTQQDFDEKANFLNKLGLGESYDDMTVISNSGNLAQMKAQICVDEKVDVFIDNSRANADAAVSAGVPLVLVPWASRV